MKLVGLLISIFALVSNAQVDSKKLKPGGVDGGGGKGVVCGETVTLLDYERAKAEWALTIVKVEGSDEFQKAFNIIERIRPLDPYRADAYQKELSEFESNSRRLVNYDMFMLHESNEAGVPARCTPVLIVKQQTPKNRFEKKYLINDLAWQKMDSDHRAGTLVHEIVLSEMRSRNEFESDNAMLFNAYITSTKFEEEGVNGYKDILRTVGFDLAYGKARYPISLESEITTYPSGKIRTAYNIANVLIEFSEDGGSISAVYFGGADRRIMIPLPSKPWPGCLPWERMTYPCNGTLFYLEIKLKDLVDHRLELYPSGRVKSLVISRNHDNFLDKDGKRVDFKANERVEFDENGRVTNARK